MLEDKGYYISKFCKQWKDTDRRLQPLFCSAVVDDPKVLLSVGTSRSLVLTDNVQCVTAYFLTSLYNVIHTELCFNHRKWNVSDKRKRIRRNKYFLSPQWTRTVIVRSHWVSTIRNIHIRRPCLLFHIFLLIRSFQRLYNCVCFQKMTNYPMKAHFLPKIKKKKIW